MNGKPEERYQAAPDKLSVWLLGTAAGQPSLTRNVSCTALKLDGSIWIVDAGEGTQHQFMRTKALRMSAVTKIFVTHAHGDHVFGLPGLLGTIAAGHGSSLDSADPRIQQAQNAKPIEFYGPARLRKFLRDNMTFTQSILSVPYVVHELLFDDEAEDTSTDLHVSERAGRNIRMSPSGVWQDFLHDAGVRVSAAPVLHSIRCLGFSFQEGGRIHLDTPKYLPFLEKNRAALLAEGYKDPRTILGRLQRERQAIALPDGTVLDPPQMGPPGRKVVILGDTYDASPALPISRDADLLVHECTNAFLPSHDPSQANGKATLESTREKAKSHGHSTPDVVARFAREVKARHVVLNHLSNKYSDVKERQDWIDEIRKQVKEGLEEGVEVTVGRDFLEVEVPRKDKHGRPV